MDPFRRRLRMIHKLGEASIHVPLKDDREQGIVLVWVSIFLGVLIAFIGLALDWSYVLLTAHQLQNTADAAALAGAQLVKSNQDDARQLAHDIGIENKAGGVFIDLDLNAVNAMEGDIVLGRFDRDLREFTPDTDAPNAVKVVARRTDSSLNGSLPLIFAPAYGVDTSQVARSAIAMTQGGGAGAAIIALDNTTPCGLDVRGTVTLTVEGGDIQVNSSHRNGVCANGPPLIDADVINVNGGSDFDGKVVYEGELNEGAPQITDPLSYLPEPAQPAANYGTIQHNGGDRTLQPGYYPGGITQTGGNLTLEPGIYYLDGEGLNIAGNSNFWAEGVMFFVHWGPVDINGTGNVHVTPPDPADTRPGFNYPEAVTYQGVSIFHARDNTHKKAESRILGTALLDLQGTLYFPSTNLTVEGTGDGFGNQLIADTIDIRGEGEILIEYDGRFPFPGNTVFLVE
jgi:hypothetical protein